MGKLVRYFLYFFGLLVILIVAAVILVPRFVDPNDFKPQIVNLVKEKTGRDIVIDGDIKLSVFPWIGISLGKVELKELPVFGKQELLAINSADVKVKLLPLLSKQIEVDRVTLDGLKLNLVILSDGNANWETLAGSKDKDGQQSVEPDKAQAEPTSPATDAAKKSEQGDFALSALSVGGISLKDAHISFDDQTAPQKVVIDQLNLNVDEVSFDNPIPFDADFIANISHPQLQDTMKVSGELTLNEAMDLFTVDKLQLNTDIEGSVVQQGKVTIDLSSAAIIVDKNTMSIQFPSGLQLRVTGAGGQLPAAFNTSLQLPKASISKQFTQFDLGALKLNAHLEGEAVKQGVVDIALNSSEIQLDINTLTAHLPTGITLDINGGGGELPEKFNASLQLPSISISNQEKFDLGQLSLNAHAEGEQFPGGKMDARLTTKISGDLASQVLSLSDIQLNAANLTVKGQLTGSKIVDAPEFKGNLMLVQLNARKLASDLGITLPKMQDAKALTKLAFNSDVSVSQQAARLTNLKILLDDSQLKGQVAINDFESQAIAFNLILDKIDVDRYLPPKSKQPQQDQQNTPQTVATEKSTDAASTEDPNNAATSSGAELIPVETIRKLNINGVLKIGEMLVNGLKAKDVKFSLKSKDGLVDARPSIGQFYAGNISTELVVDARKQQPTLKITNRVAKIAIEPLLKELMDKTYISGTANMTTNLTSQGATEQAILATLNGEVTANFLDGAIYGVNIPKMIRDGISTLKGQAVDTEAVNKTDFSELNMVSKVNNGIVTTEKLELKSPLLRILGQGTLDLNTKKLEYRTRVKLVDTLKGQGGNTPTDLTGIPIPLLITGTLDKIRYELDTKAAMQEVFKTKVGKQAKGKAKAVIDKNKGKVMDKINKKLGGESGKSLKKGAGELLKGLF
ncbi:MAG: AsmA family protein [Methylococcales bacterium]